MSDAGEGKRLSWTRGVNETPIELRLHEANAPLPVLPPGLRESVALMLLALLALALFPGGRRWLAALWPEQLTLLVIVGILIAGLSIPAAVLLLFALAGRVLLLVRWARHQISLWWHKPKDDPSSVYFQPPSEA